MSNPRPAGHIPIEDTPEVYLARLGQAGDGPHDLATAALMLAALDHPDRKLARFHSHLSELAEKVRAEADFARDGESAASALSSVLAGHYGYEGERGDYDDPGNADKHGDRQVGQQQVVVAHSILCVAGVTGC